MSKVGVRILSINFVISTKSDKFAFRPKKY